MTEQQHRIWEDWAREDPLWAILSDPARKDGGWNADLPEFFASGRRDLEAMVATLSDLGVDVRYGRALDFGCGVGRLTQALATRFTRCDGVDISETMIELARGYNRISDRCQYHRNVRDDLSIFPDETFDLIVTLIVLQHNPPELAEHYIREFVRLLTPEGVAVFDMPANIRGGAELPDGSHHAEITFAALPAAVRAGQPVCVRVSVTNTSGVDWPVRSLLSLGNHWALPDGTAEVLDDGRLALPHGLAAGADTVVELKVGAPSQPGLYDLQLDLVEEGVCWFADRGSRPASAVIDVRPPRRRLRERILGARSNHGVQAAEAGAPAPAPFTMNALPRDRVEAIVEMSGGRVLDVSASYVAGPECDGYRYVISRNPAQGH